MHRDTRMVVLNTRQSVVDIFCVGILNTTCDERNREFFHEWLRNAVSKIWRIHPEPRKANALTPHCCLSISISACLSTLVRRCYRFAFLQ